MNLVEAIQQECNRVRESRRHYLDLGPVGMFGAAMLAQAIESGEAAISSMDPVRMMMALTELRDCK